MQENKAKPTIEDVAKYCGVSVSTVSRVINRSTPVSAELNLKVRQAIKELEFTPRQWKDRTGKKTVILVVPDILSPFYAEILSGAQGESDRLGINLIIINIGEDPELQKEHLTLLSQWMFDGLIVTGTWLPSEFLVKLQEEYNLPIVVSRSKETPQFPCIFPDTSHAVRQAINYLISLNHKRIAFLSGPAEWNSSKIRLLSIQEALSESGISLPSELYRTSAPSIEGGFQAMHSLLTLAEDTRPTAVFAFNDIMAVGVLRAIHGVGLKVPQDISVIGTDDIALAAYTVPALTTIAQPTYRIGQLTVQKIAALLQRKAMFEAEMTLLECPLILRESTGPCPM